MFPQILAKPARRRKTRSAGAAACLAIAAGTLRITAQRRAPRDRALLLPQARGPVNSAGRG